MKQTILLAVMLLLLFIPMVSAQFNNPVDDDTDQFDEILEPIFKIYNFIKYAATVIAVLVLVFAGISMVTSGGDPGKREMAKNMAMYVVLGLVIIWAAPLVVNLIVG